MNIEFERAVTPDQVREVLEKSPGVKLIHDAATHTFPMPILASGQDDVLVGRIRQDTTLPDGRRHRFVPGRRPDPQGGGDQRRAVRRVVAVTRSGRSSRQTRSGERWDRGSGGGAYPSGGGARRRPPARTAGEIFLQNRSWRSRNGGRIFPPLIFGGAHRRRRTSRFDRPRHEVPRLVGSRPLRSPCAPRRRGDARQRHARAARQRVRASSNNGGPKSLRGRWELVEEDETRLGEP